MNPLGRLALACCRAWSHVAPMQRGEYRLTRLARSLIPRRQWSGDFQTPDGVRLRLDLATYPDCCMANGLYELDTLRLLKRLLRSGDHFVDLGANIGYFTLQIPATSSAPMGASTPSSPIRLTALVLRNTSGSTEHPGK
ncbi:MAG: hypothetical protein ACREV4_06155 [Gammaproteobacteria bacterium]